MYHVYLTLLCVIGDSGYMAEPFLLTPIVNAEPGSREDNYTRRHCQVRNCIERAFGVLKIRWRCLRQDRVLKYEPQSASNIITACAVLHNILMKYRYGCTLSRTHINYVLTLHCFRYPMPDEERPDDHEEHDPINAEDNGQPRAEARQVRQRIINTYF